MKRVYFFSYLIMLCTLGVVDAEAVGKRHSSGVIEDRAWAAGDVSAPVDRGWGPGRGPLANEGFKEFDAAALVGGPNAHIQGVFGDSFTWPIIPIHAALLPNGKVYTFGSEGGPYSAALVHDLWDPERGTGASAHTPVDNTTPTNTFCGAQALFPNSGRLLITGGDTTGNGEPNGEPHYGTADTNLFDYTATKLSSVEPMAYKRWYPTLVPRENGEMVVVGGRQGKHPSVYGSTPEVYTPAGPNKGWRTLTTAKNKLAYGKSYESWNYPHAFPASNGRVFILAHHGEMFYLNPAGTGSITRATNTLAPNSNVSLASVNFAPGMIMSLRFNKRVIIVNLNTTPPSRTDTAPISSLRYWSNTTVLADGKVVVTGGSGVDNTLTNVTYRAEIWDPSTGKWTLGDAAQIPRLYHSSAVLLPDATVFTGGGGANGPVDNLNAEIFYPPYLWKTDGSGLLADRPSIVSSPVAVALGDDFNVTVASGDSIKRVTWVRNGSTTHSFDHATSFYGVVPDQSGTTLTVTAPANANVAMPGYWMMFVINQNGVPSVAKIVHLVTS